jgi:hypothetical protein
MAISYKAKVFYFFIFIIFELIKICLFSISKIISFFKLNRIIDTYYQFYGQIYNERFIFICLTFYFFANQHIYVFTFFYSFTDFYATFIEIGTIKNLLGVSKLIYFILFQINFPFLFFIFLFSLTINKEIN